MEISSGITLAMLICKVLQAGAIQALDALGASSKGLTKSFSSANTI